MAQTITYKTIITNYEGMCYIRDYHFNFLTRIRSRYLKALFFMVVFAYTLLLVGEAVTYDSAAQLFPLVVGIPLLGLTAVKIVHLVFQNRFDFEVVELFENADQVVATSDEDTIEPSEQYRRQFNMILWTLGLLVLTWLVGHLLALVVFVFTFVYVYERSLGRAILASGLTFVFVYLLFIQLLGSSLWEGLIRFQFGGIPL